MENLSMYFKKRHSEYEEAYALLRRYAGKESEKIIEQVREDAKTSPFSFLDLLYDKINKIRK